MGLLMACLLALSAGYFTVPEYDIHYANTMGFEDLEHHYSRQDDRVYLTADGVIIAAFPARQNCTSLRTDTAGTIWFPDQLGGVTSPQEFAVNPGNQSVYVIGEYGQNIAVCDIQSGARTDCIMTGKGTTALVHSQTQNKIYSTSYYDFAVDVVDCATNNVIKTIPLNGALTDICWNSASDRVYCSNIGMYSVDVIDCAADSQIKRIFVGENPRAVLYNPISNKVYCAYTGNVAIIDCMVDTVIATVPVGSAQYFFAFNPTNNKVYCLNRSSNTVSIIDGAANTLLATVGVNSFPECISYNPVTNRVYVGHSAGQSVVVIDGGTDQVVATIPVGQAIYASACDTIDNRLFLASSYPQVVAINCSTNAIAGNLPAMNWPRGIFWEASQNNIWIGNTGATNLPGFTVQGYEADNFTPLFKTALGYTPYSTMVDTSTNKYYAAGRGDDILAIFDMSDPDTAALLTVRDGPWDVCDNPVENKVYCANRYESRVSVIDATSNATLAEVNTGQYPVALARSPMNNRIYAVCFWGNRVTVIDGATNSFVTHINVGSGPYDILYNPTGNKIYSIDYGNNTVTIIDAATNSVLATVPAGNWPWSAVHNPVDNKVYVANYASHDITVIDGVTNQVTATIPLGGNAYPFTLAYNPQNNRLYSANIFSAGVMVIDASTNTILTTLPIPGGPHALVYDAENNALYCAYVNSDWQDAVVVFDGSTNAVLADFVLPAHTRSYGLDSPKKVFTRDAVQGFVYLSHYTSSKITVIETGTGIAEHTPEAPGPRLLSISPNPTRGTINIRCMMQDSGYRTEDLRLTIYDAAGRVVIEEALERGEAEHAVSLSGMSPGVYFVVVEDGAGLTASKFVVLR